MDHNGRQIRRSLFALARNIIYLRTYGHLFYEWTARGAVMKWLTFRWQPNKAYKELPFSSTFHLISIHSEIPHRFFNGLRDHEDAEQPVHVDEVAEDGRHRPHELRSVGTDASERGHVVWRAHSTVTEASMVFEKCTVKINLVV